MLCQKMPRHMLAHIPTDDKCLGSEGKTPVNRIQQNRSIRSSERGWDVLHFCDEIPNLDVTVRMWQTARGGSFLGTPKASNALWVGTDQCAKMKGSKARGFAHF